MDPLALDFAKAGELLDVSASTIRRLADAGEIQTVHVGRSRRVVVDSLKQWVETRAAPGYDASENEAGLAAEEKGGDACPSPNEAATGKDASSTEMDPARSGRSTTTPTDGDAAARLARRIGIERPPS
ncbi:helix-turn-helix domain-containing protein [Thiohalorhabdus denitrificans]|uniref:DNA binding domain-containing protein, excisionase family n=1 Tax=Thiohalorhabdus denitrificans TaxID=381306 RepID=A0A1G5HFF8_9GAMM|nr:DNA binding domain-containing protein, excisionase family [Thiohalorhabdus denitrificans]